jgi:hypothetical protein
MKRTGIGPFWRLFAHHPRLRYLPEKMFRLVMYMDFLT